MRRPQFTLFFALVVLSISAVAAAWLATGSHDQLPNPDPGSLYTIAVSRGSGQIAASIAISLALVVLTWITLLLAGQNRRWLGTARVLWTLGYASYLAHVAFAFATYHDWSHAKAAWHTGFRTWELTGWFWMGGIWINYAFTLVWGGDVIYWWSGLDRYGRRPDRLRWFVHAFFAFMIFQAGIVFASGATRWITLAGLSLVALVGLLRLARSRSPASP